MRQTPDTIRLLSPGTVEDWAQAERLMTELKEWDVQQCQPLGFDRDDVLNTFYPDDMESIRRDSVPPHGRFLLAVDANSPVGCAAFRRFDDTACELYDVYVCPVARSRGVAPMLLRRLMSDAKTAGYQAMLLETAVFMHSAHKIYRSMHFQTRGPYRATPTRFQQATLWMEC